ncbi:MAG: DUF6894 family protein [Bosea sp. (in: a-proteobacteria)]
MARYFFDTHDSQPSQDQDGLEFDDREAALAALPDMLKERDLGSLRDELAITVRDEQGPLFTTTLKLLTHGR